MVNGRAGSISPALFVPREGVIVIGVWGTDVRRATFTGTHWLVEMDDGDTDWRDMPPDHYYYPASLDVKGQ